MQTDFLAGLGMPATVVQEAQAAATRAAVLSLTQSLDAALKKQAGIEDELTLAKRDAEAIRQALNTLSVQPALPIISDSPSAVAPEAPASIQVGEPIIQPSPPVVEPPSYSVPKPVIEDSWFREKKMATAMTLPKAYGYDLFDRAGLAEVIGAMEPAVVADYGSKGYGEAIGQSLSKMALRGVIAKFVKKNGADGPVTATYYVSLEWLLDKESGIALPEHTATLAGLEFVPPKKKENKTAPADEAEA